jgi:lysozyme
MIIKYEDYILEGLLNENVLNEEINFDKIENMVSKINNKKEAIEKVIQKFNKTTNRITRKYLATILLILIIGTLSIKNIINVRHKIDQATEKIIDKENINVNDIVDISKSLVIDGKLQKSNIYAYKLNAPFVDLKTAVTTDSTKQLIKEHEKLSLVAYELGDGKVTIGYGHAKSIYKKGDAITIEVAEAMFARDIRNAENAIRRMLDDWKKEGYNIEITQGMFDAMISMVFNMGVRGFRNTSFVVHLRRGDYLAAAEVIRTTKVDDNFPGLLGRRESEYKLFIKDLS